MVWEDGECQPEVTMGGLSRKGEENGRRERRERIPHATTGKGFVPGALSLARDSHLFPQRGESVVGACRQNKPTGGTASHAQ